MAQGVEPVLVTFEQWTQGRTVSSLGTNSGADALPFQSWRHFKEAFAPELIARAIAESRIPVRTCLDPFGGSGTTALASQFLGVHPITAEVNPFLADLIEAKLSVYDADELARDLAKVIRHAAKSTASADQIFANAPKTFVEPGVNGRWIFDRVIADRLAALLTAIDVLAGITHRRLFRVLFGGILVDVSNVVVNGKGRRYRENWKRRRRDVDHVYDLFCSSARQAISEVYRFSQRKCTSFNLFRGDSRKLLQKVKSCDLAIFSPPYPNSFDYTDVYNIELWTLGYLGSASANQRLRSSTISSHVQASRAFSAAPTASGVLKTTIRKLAERRGELWDQRIPEMIGGYFADLTVILDHIHRVQSSNGAAWMVLGDSCYAGVQVPVAEILAQIASGRGWEVETMDPFRSMRASAQQGGRHELAENLLVLRKRLSRRR